MNSKQQLKQVCSINSYKKIQSLKSSELDYKCSESIISKYNLFIKCYNRECNRINEKTLSFMSDSKTFDLLYYCIDSIKSRTLFLFLFFICGLNIIMLIFLFFSIIKYFKCVKVYRKNEDKISNPFENMKFDQEKCFQLKKNFHFFIVNFKSLNQFNLKQNTQLIERKDKSQWMIYNRTFQSYYKDFINWKIRIIFLFVTAIIQTVFSNLLLILLIL